MHSLEAIGSTEPVALKLARGYLHRKGPSAMERPTRLSQPEHGVERNGLQMFVVSPQLAYNFPQDWFGALI